MRKVSILLLILTLMLGLKYFRDHIQPVHAVFSATRCVNTTCYLDYDQDGFRSTSSAIRCVVGGDCTTSPDRYNQNSTAVIDCNDAHYGPNKCCWTLGGTCSGCPYPRTNTSSSHIVYYSGCSTGVCKWSSKSCWTVRRCSSDGTGQCGRLTNNVPYPSTCSYTKASCGEGPYVACYQYRKACTWSW